jgi:hypothetical protein
VRVALKDKLNYAWKGSGNDDNLESGDLVFSFVIGKATYDMSGITFASATFDEDGNVHSLAITGQLPVGVSVIYTGNGQTDEGDYLVTATFVGNENYNDVDPLFAHLIIKQAVVSGGDGDDENADNNFVAGSDGNSSLNNSTGNSSGNSNSSSNSSGSADLPVIGGTSGGESSANGGNTSGGDSINNSTNNAVSNTVSGGTFGDGAGTDNANENNTISGGTSSGTSNGTLNDAESNTNGGSDGYLPTDTTEAGKGTEEGTADGAGSADYIIEISAQDKAAIPTYVYWIIATVSFVFGMMALSSAAYFIRGKLREKKNRKHDYT